MSKFANSIGVWELEIGGVPLSLKPDMSDVKLFRNLITNDKIRKNKVLLFDKVGDFLQDLILRESPEENKDDVRAFIELNINELFEECMIAFRWAKRDELEKQKAQAFESLKKDVLNG